MAAEMIKEGKRLVRELGVHPTKVVEGIESGVRHACDLLEKETKNITLDGDMLEQIVKTSLSSKLDGKQTCFARYLGFKDGRKKCSV